MKKISAKIKLSGLLAFITIIFLGVKCEKPDTVGPPFSIAPADFTVNTFAGSTTSVNFTPVGTTFAFNANFSAPVSWIIELKGLSSGATKTIRGASQVIDGSNPEWLWDGAHDGLYFFMRNEQVEATITFLGSGTVAKDTITVTGTKTFKDVYIGDFENPATMGWPNWIPGGYVAFGDGDPAFGGRYVTKDSIGENIVQGQRALKLWGYDGNASYFVAGLRRENLNALLTFPTDPSQLYFNIYVFGNGDANSRLNFGAQEDDADGPVGTHEPASDDEFQVQLSGGHIGWKLFSFKYTDLIPGANPSYGGNGNKTHQPKRITGITFGLISSPPKNNVQIIMDYPILSFGGPFDPSK